ncbi:MAG TPA: hypothetical protein VEY50_07130 [Lysobacter sp.]|nr:hypothetical protein [Lysobacter sp.]
MTLVLALPAQAAPPAVPEIVRAPATAQAVGAVHTVRTIPEACTRLEGVFTGAAAQPYRLSAVRTSPRCQPRARFVDAAQAKPSPAAGWVFNDEIRIPSGACPDRQAVVRVWRKPGDAAPPRLDAQGRARLYLADVQRKSDAAVQAALPQFAAVLVQDGSCG